MRSLKHNWVFRSNIELIIDFFRSRYISPKIIIPTQDGSLISEGISCQSIIVINNGIMNLNPLFLKCITQNLFNVKRHFSLSPIYRFCLSLYILSDSFFRLVGPINKYFNLHLFIRTKLTKFVDTTFYKIKIPAITTLIQELIQIIKSINIYFLP